MTHLPFPLTRATRYSHALGEIERAPAVAHASGRPETVATHTLALALTAWDWMGDLELGGILDGDRVIRYALAHDLSEAITGDENTFGASEARLAAKAEAEKAAVATVVRDFDEGGPGAALGSYVGYTSPESYYVRCVDKMLPKINRALRGDFLTASEVDWCRGQMERELNDIGPGPVAYVHVILFTAVRQKLAERWAELLKAITPPEADREG